MRYLESTVKPVIPIPSPLELNEAQKRQVIDGEQVFQAFLAAQQEAWRHRGSMFWREQSGKTYLIKVRPDGRQRSLGPRSPDLEKTFEAFMSGKERIEERLKTLREQVDVMRRLNRALRVGRTPDVVVRVLNAIQASGVGRHFLLVGTNALYAYESAAGVRLASDVMSTMDADLLFDTTARADFLEVMQDRKMSFLDLLRKADSSFRRDDADMHAAVNDSGYQIEVIRRFPPPELEAVEHPMRMTEDEGDLWAMRATTGQKLLSVRRFEQVVVGTSGEMAMMRTVHPLDFARIKRELSGFKNRSPLKASKDALQAMMVEQLVQTHLQHLLQPPHDDGEAERPVVERG